MSDIGRLGGSRLQGPMGCLSKHKCPECGKTFECGSQWGYARRTIDGNRAYYCSYRCFRVAERKDEERERERNERLDAAREYNRQWQERKKLQERQEQERREQAQLYLEQRKAERAEQCRERIAHYAALAAVSPKGSRTRKNARENAARWREKLAACEGDGGKNDG